jgi:membrane-associated HD superfamily phosphohydrolase
VCEWRFHFNRFGGKVELKTVRNLLSSLQAAWHKSRGWLAGIALAALVSAIVALPILPVGRVDLQAGDVAPRDVRSPRRVSYISNILTEREQDRAEASTPPVYTPPDSRIVRQQIAYARRVMDAIRAARADNTISLAQKWAALENVAGISLSNSQVQAILNLNDDEWSQKVI